ncbi:fimbrial protein [Proteiniphilum sp. UBA5384]|uniref:fimbrial protein n=1 Tax=Proteiniphilum sp. UBA5384 TaxID=1947279 RepID=UPI0025DE6CCF|nr:fimbrial protein [Proteiniphilum sp. UBA5384]
MKKTAYISAALSLSLLFAACNSGQEIPQPAGQQVEIVFSMDNYTKVVTSTKSVSTSQTRASEAVGSEKENIITDLNLFLFDTNGQNPKSYYFDTSTTTSGTWTHSTADRKGNIKLNLTQAEAGKRRVYIVANYGSVLSPSTIDDLKGVSRSTDTPWSTTLATPILMSGDKEHNFITNRVLGGDTDEPVHLTRVLAKLELNIKLKKEHQSKPVIQEGVPNELVPKHQYHYAFLNFEKETHLLSLNNKTTNNLAHEVLDPIILKEVDSRLWKQWTADVNGITSYTTNGDGEVIHMTLTTYLNERAFPDPRSFIGLWIPYNGAVPPPEFGPDLTGIYLPQLKRNHWYVYDVEI